MKSIGINFSNFFLFLNIYFAFLFIRFPYILKIPSLKFVILFTFFVGCLLGILSCFYKFKRLTIALLFFTFCIFFHALCNFYQPSLRTNISIQNYSVISNITSDFLFSQTRLYLMYFVLFLFPVTTFLFHIKENKNSKLGIYLVISLFFITLVNSVVAIYQGKININFLAAESLAAIEAGRAPALFDDSGVAAFFFAISASVFLANLAFLKLSFISKLINIFFLTLTITTGIINDSRSFYIGFLINIIFIIFIKIFLFFKNKEYKNLITTTFIVTIIFFIGYYLYNNSTSNSLIRIKHFVNNNLNELSFHSLYNNLDSDRYKHFLIMVENIKSNLFSGSGLGSFLGNIEIYKKRLNLTEVAPDVPTNLFLSLVSELGIIVGLFPIFLLCFPFLIAFWKVVNLNNINSVQLKTNINIVSTISIFSGFSFIVLSFTSYMIFVPSLAIIACFLIVSPFTLLAEPQRNKVFSFLFYSILLLSFYLLAICGKLIYQSKPIPYFHWHDRGIAQTPLEIGQLPQTKNSVNPNRIYFAKFLSPSEYLFLPAGASKGRWLKQNTELLLLTKDMRIYIGPESRHFPVSLDVIFYSNSDFSLAKKYNIQKAGWVYFSLPEAQEFNSCFDNISENSFCYYHVRINPSWKPNFLNSIGFFIEDKYTPGQ